MVRITTIITAALLCIAAPASAQQVKPATKGGTMVVNFLGPVTSASMAAIVSAAQDAVLVGADEIQISISSGGGKVYAARFAVNALAALPIRVTTVAMSDVSSAAVALFCAGEERYAAPGSTVYLHQITRFAERSLKTAAAQGREDSIVQDWYDGMLRGCVNTDANMREIRRYRDRDLIFTHEDIHRLGMANQPFEALREKKIFGRAITVVPGDIQPLATAGRR